MEKQTYYVDDIVRELGSSETELEYSIAAVQENEATIIPLGKGMPKRIATDKLELIKSRLRDFLSLPTFKEFIDLIMGVEITYSPKKRGKKKENSNEEVTGELDL